MSLFDRLTGGRKEQNNQPDPRQGYQQMMRDPIGFFSRLGINIPSGMNDPCEIIEHLHRSGQIPENVYSEAMRLYKGRPQ